MLVFNDIIMITKEQFRKDAKFNIENNEFELSVYSKIFDKDIKLKVIPELPDSVNEKDGITDRIIEIINDLINLDFSNLSSIQEIVWKCFNHYSELCSFTLNVDDEQYEKGEISKDEYQLLNKKRQQDLYEIYNKEDCWNKIKEPEYRTSLSPRIWNHRFGLIVFYPEWEEDGLNILVRNGEIIGYANGPDPIIRKFDDPKLKSVYELCD